MKNNVTKFIFLLTVIIACISFPATGCASGAGWEKFTLFSDSDQSGGAGRSVSLNAPAQDADGYYLLDSIEDFKWFISACEENTGLNVRLTQDLILNDTSHWIDWTDSRPENGFKGIIHYNGHFDGCGFAIEGYYSACEEKWQTPIFLTLEEDAVITNLQIRNAIFRTTYKDSFYLDENDRTNIASSSALCYYNYGRIEGCQIDASVFGAWSAGGIASFNYGEITDCHFTGTLEAGLEQSKDMPESGLASDALYAGGICRTNEGVIENCTNKGSITLHSLSGSYYMNYSAGGIAGRVSADGIIENCENSGPVECVQLAGGIAGASWGRISKCINSGNVHVEQADWDHAAALIGAGICASNGGSVTTCLNTGSVTIHQIYLSFYAPIYGVACNTVNPGKGSVENCYYVKENTAQVYRQSGVHKLSSKDAADFSAYLTMDKKIPDVDTFELLNALPNYPGTDEEDYIHLKLGPDSGIDHEIKPGDSLWKIAEEFYGDGLLYDKLEYRADSSLNHFLIPGGHITVPPIDYYLLCANDEEGFSWSYCQLPSGESCPTHFIAAKPINWYYGSMDIPEAAGLEVLWPKQTQPPLTAGPQAADDTALQDAAASDIRILYRFDGNPGGDFFAPDWMGVQDSIRKSAKAYCGKAADGFRFYRYKLDNGESLYGYSFRLYRQTDTLKCTVFYRIREGFLAEFIGIEPVGEDEQLLERVRYLAARTDSLLTIDEIQYDYESFCGRDNWDFPQLHNPFAIALAYSKEAECNSFVLFTGVQ